MSTPNQKPNRPSSWERFLILLTFVYLLRFPLLTAIFLVVFPYFAIGTGAASLLENLFDLEWAGVLFVALAAFLAAWSVMVTSRLVLLYCHRRFRIPPVRISTDVRWKHIILYALLALPIIIGVYWEVALNWRYTTQADNLWKIAAVVPGLILALILLWSADLLQKLLNRPATNRQAPNLLIPPDATIIKGVRQKAEETEPVITPPKKLAEWLRSIPPFFGRGYIDYSANPEKRVPLLTGHGMAIGMMMAFIVVYAIVGVIASPWLRKSDVPSLAYVLLLLTMLNWTLSGMAYFFDRYRIPVSILILVLLVVGSYIFPRSDSYYLAYPKVQSREARSLLPESVIRPFDNSKVILIAANGGGIQSAAWTARVLTGLELSCRNSPDCGGRNFGKSIRLISAVSGGSVGSMYFANAYGEDGGDGLPADERKLNKVVELAMRSSLNGVAWGMVYPDFLRTVLPFFSELPFFWKTDRGRSLEMEWQRDVPSLKAMLGDWRNDVAAGKRPATVFNTTISDTGQPLLFSTVDHQIRESMTENFNRLFKGEYDVPVVTAVRLSASFPYVTPAARADIGGPSTPQYHVVDGGYYDNYGMAALVEWLDAALEQAGNEIKEVLVIRIHGAPVGGAQAPKGDRGFLYQATVPILSLNSVRGAGQLSHSIVEFDLLQRDWAQKGVRIELATFVFPKSKELSDEPPLSWHLTEKQKRMIEMAWKEYVDDPQSAISDVKKFLAR